MKKTIPFFALAILTLTSCNNNKPTNNTMSEQKQIVENIWTVSEQPTTKKYYLV